MRLLVITAGCEDDVLPLGEYSTVLACWRLGRGIALGFVFWEVGVTVLSYMYAALEAKESEPCSSFAEGMEATDIRLVKAWLSCSRPIVEVYSRQHCEIRWKWTHASARPARLIRPMQDREAGLMSEERSRP